MLLFNVNYSLLTSNECNENYSDNELRLYAQWLENLYKSDFLGPRSRITEIVLNRILNETIKKYNITRNSSEKQSTILGHLDRWFVTPQVQHKMENYNTTIIQTLYN